MNNLPPMLGHKRRIPGRFVVMYATVRSRFGLCSMILDERFLVTIPRVT